MDEIASQTEEPVVMQIGTSKIIPRNCEFARFYSSEAFEGYISRSRVVVAHAGIGTILAAIRGGRPLVCLPRRREFRELWDDHQLEMCRTIAAAGTLRFVEDENDLTLQVLEEATVPRISNTRGRLPNAILSDLGLRGGTDFR